MRALPSRSRWLLGIALGTCALGAILTWALRTPPLRLVDININHGLSDCPWPYTVRDPNMPSAVPRPAGDVGIVTLHDVRLVLRDDDRVLFSGRVKELDCYRPLDLGPGLDIWLPSDAGDDDTPPPMKSGARSLEDPLGTMHAHLYRIGTRMMRDFHVTDRRVLDNLQDFYVSQTDGVWLNLGRVGSVAQLQLELAPNMPAPVARMLLDFFYAPGPEHRPCTMAQTDPQTLPACPVGTSWIEPFRPTGSAHGPDGGTDDAERARAAFGRPEERE
ncbi:MAG: hypothetical protein ACLP6E_07350 [Acidimicrobiales bacterium]|jgi:hypothetical protein